MGTLRDVKDGNGKPTREKQALGYWGPSFLTVKTARSHQPGVISPSHPP